MHTMKPKQLLKLISDDSSALKDPEVLERALEIHTNCSKSYYEVGKSALNDEEFDLLEKRLKKAFPGWKPPIGAPVNKKVERELVVPCASLTKIQAENVAGLERWLSNFNPNERILVEAKIDGASLLGHYKSSNLESLTTRGDGQRGKSIDGYIEAASSSHRSSGLRTQLVSAPHKELALRFEVAASLPVYEKHLAENFDSSRVVASAAFNRKVPDANVVSRLDYVLIEGWYKEGKKMAALSSAELDTLAVRNKMPQPQRTILLKREVTAERLSEILNLFRGEGRYDLDGLVIRPESYHLLERHPSGENPEYARAFKVNDLDSAPETVIEEIIWNTSSFGVLVPKARIKPIMFGNVKVVHAALHNVEWATERGAGVGAVVKVLRSGEIIPKIVHVVKPAKFVLPVFKLYGPYEKIGKKLVLKSVESAEVRAKKIARMFQILGLDSLGGSLAKKMVEAGFDTTAKVARMSQTDLMTLPGVKSSSAKFATEIAKIRKGSFTAPRLFLASGVADAGLGESTMKKLVKKCPEVFKSSVRKQNVLELSKVIGPAFASTFAAAWPKFLEWMSEVKPKVEPIAPPAPTPQGKLSGKVFSWTGYRSKEEEEFVASLGGEVAGFGSRTTVLFYKPDGKASSKVEKAGSRACLFSNWLKTVKR